MLLAMHLDQIYKTVHQKYQKNFHPLKNERISTKVSIVTDAILYLKDNIRKMLFLIFINFELF
jgi:hypothetical protein